MKSLILAWAISFVLLTLLLGCGPETERPAAFVPMSEQEKSGMRQKMRDVGVKLGDRGFRTAYALSCQANWEQLRRLRD